MQTIFILRQNHLMIRVLISLKRIWIRIILCLFITMGCSHRVIVTDTWPDGKPQRSEKTMRDGHKIEYSYYPSGNLEFKALYFNGMLDGQSEYWDDNGNIKSVSTYSAGKLHGLWRQYHPNGKIIHTVGYFHGQKDGLEIWYWENGQKKSEQYFEFDQPASKLKRWDAHGKPLN